MLMSPGLQQLLVIWTITARGLLPRPSVALPLPLPLSTPQVTSDSGAISTTPRHRHRQPPVWSKAVPDFARERQLQQSATAHELYMLAASLHHHDPSYYHISPTALPASHTITHPCRGRTPLHSSRLTSHDCYQSPMIIPRDNLRRRNITPAL